MPLIVKNLTDRRYLMFGQDQLAVVGMTRGTFFRLRTFSIQVTRKF